MARLNANWRGESAEQNNEKEGGKGQMGVGGEMTGGQHGECQQRADPWSKGAEEKHYQPAQRFQRSSHHATSADPLTACETLVALIYSMTVSTSQAMERMAGGSAHVPPRQLTPG